MSVTITIDFERACSECGAKGVAQNGLCLKCIKKRLLPKGRAQPMPKRPEI